MTKYVASRLEGRLGNAIFRYFTCAKLAMKHNLTYTLETDWTEKDNEMHAFTYYKGRDIGGHDLKYYNEPDIMNICIRDSRAIGYNTLGFLKDYFEKPLLESSVYINHANNQGLYVKRTLHITEDNYRNMSRMNLSDFNLLVEGYFQYDIDDIERETLFAYIEKHKHEHYINGHFPGRVLMKDIIDDQIIQTRYDIAIHIRLDDFRGKRDFIDYEYYEKLFSQLDFTDRQTCLVIGPVTTPEDAEYLDKCLNWFAQQGYSVTVESNDVLTDFNIMKQCNTLVCSMSTLSWSAATLSRYVKTCYMPNYNFCAERPHCTFKNPGGGLHVRYYDVASTTKNVKAMVITTSKERSDTLKGTLLQIGLELQKVYGVDNYYIWKKLLADTETERYIIFEDDAKLTCSPATLSTYLDNLPADFDIITLSRNDMHTFELLEYVNEYFYRPVKRGFNRATGTILSKRGARKLIETYGSIDDNLYCRSDFEYLVSKEPLILAENDNKSD